MKKKDGGFTLIELLIALAVLSIMAGVLLQSFVLSRRMNTKARKEELVLDAAKRTMEELKGYPFEELEKFLSGEGEAADGEKEIMIGKTVYRLERLTDAEGSADNNIADQENMNDENPSGISLESGRGYRLVAEYGRELSVDGKAAYIICADADFERYSSTSEDNLDKSYSINQYRMPNIADVSSFQNVVVEPQTLMKDNEFLTAELLLKVNPDEEDEEVYDEGDVKRYLTVTVGEMAGSGGTGGEKGTLTVQVQAVYTVDNTVSENWAESLSIVTNLASFKKNVVKEKEEGDPENRVYLFLPDENTRYVWPADEKEVNGDTAEPETETAGFPGFDTIFIRAEDLEERIEFYLVAASEEQDRMTDLVLPSVEKKNFAFFSNLGDHEQVSLHEAEKRLYHLTVTVCEAVYEEGETHGIPMMGREILKLDSTKSE